MASIVTRGTTTSVKYVYLDEADNEVQQWESYKSKLDAAKRKAVIDFLQENGENDKIRELAIEYKVKKAEEKHARAVKKAGLSGTVTIDRGNNLTKSFAEFAEDWVPVHVSKNKLDPLSYDSLKRNIKNHIVPYFGDKPLSTITAQDIDEFIIYLGKKKCEGSKSYNKTSEEIPALASSTVKKVYDVLYSALPVAREWGYIKAVPKTKAPAVKYKKRKFWTAEQVMEAVGAIRDKELRLAVHMAFVCSLRPGETVAVSRDAINLEEKSLWVKQTLQRVSEESLEQIDPEEIIIIFPKKLKYSKSRLILKTTKGDEDRKVFLTDPLIEDIKDMLKRIDKNMAFFEDDYMDYGLLFCYPDGTPIEPTRMVKRFREWQRDDGIIDILDMQSLRKSGQMHKIRLSKFDYQTVAGVGGHSPEVMLKNYDEVLDSEKKALAQLLQLDLYSSKENNISGQNINDTQMAKLFEMAQQKPELFEMLLKTFSD